MNYRTIIRTNEAVSLLNHPRVVFLDCRASLQDKMAGRRDWEAGHLPGAHFLDLEADLSGVKNGHNGRHPLPDWQEFSAKIAQCGISQDTQVIVYDSNMAFAPRLWWMLRYLGHESVAVLDGGMTKWQRENLPVTQEALSTLPGNFRPTLPHPDWLVSADDLLALLPEQPCIIDARAADRYAGDNETMDPVGGHIPGARNHFFGLNFQADGTFRSPEALRMQFMELMGDIGTGHPIHQCGSGVTACVNFLAMEIANMPPGRLYAGSWSEWCKDPRCPIVKGSRPSAS